MYLYVQSQKLVAEHYKMNLGEKLDPVIYK